MCELSIIIVSWNVKQLLRDCVRSIMETTALDYEIIVVDNASSDGAARALDEFSDRVTVIPLDRNTGFASAVNTGLAQCRGDCILLLNPDTVIYGNSLETMLRFLESSDTAGIAGPKVVESDGRLQGSARKFPSYRTALFGRNSLLHKLARNNRYSRQETPCFHHASQAPLQVDWVTGACMMFKRKLMIDIGELDERFFMYWEDADWCLRAKAGGWNTHWVPAAKIMHIGGASSRLSPFTSAMHYYRSVFKYYSKNIGANAPAPIRLIVWSAVRAWCAGALISALLKHTAARLTRPASIKHI